VHYCIVFLLYFNKNLYKKYCGGRHAAMVGRHRRVRGWGARLFKNFGYVLSKTILYAADASGGFMAIGCKEDEDVWSTVATRDAQDRTFGWVVYDCHRQHSGTEVETG
jgi:hypothetical protein